MTCDRARRPIADRSECVGSPQRTLRNLGSTASQVFFKIRPRRNIGIGFIIFQRPLLYRRVNLPKIIDTGIFRALAITAWKIGHRHKAHQTDEQEHHENQSGILRRFHERKNTAEPIRLLDEKPMTKLSSPLHGGFIFNCFTASKRKFNKL